MASTARAEPTVTLSDRLDRHSIPEPNSGCTLWFGATAADGYGRIHVRGRPVLAHRAAIEVATGLSVGKSCVMHTCDNPACINPDHLRVGSVADNMADRDRKRRQAHGERHGSAKLTEEKVIAIRASAKTERELMAEYGIGRSTLQKVKAGRTWAYLLNSQP